VEGLQGRVAVVTGAAKGSGRSIAETLAGNGAQGSDLDFGPETVDSYELGIKSSPSRQFTFNLAAFYAKYKNLQNPAGCH